MDTTIRWGMASALTTQASLMAVVHVASKPDSAYTKWLGHHLLHVLLKIQARRNPQWQATKVPADLAGR